METVVCLVVYMIYTAISHKIQRWRKSRFSISHW